MPVQEFLFTVDPRTDKNLSSINEQLRSLTNREDPLTLDNFISFDVIGYSGLRSVVIRVTMEVNAFYARTTFPVNGAAFSQTAAPQAIKLIFNSKVNEGSITDTSIKYNGASVAASNITLESDGYTLSVDTSGLSYNALQTHTVELISLRDKKGNTLSKQDVFSYVVGTSGSATSDRGNPEPYTYNDKVGDFKVTSFVIDRYSKIADKITEYLKTNNIDRESVIAQDILNVNEHTLEVYILYFSDLFPSVIRTFPQEGALVSSDGVPTEAIITFSQPTHINITEANNITFDGVDLSASGTLSDDNRTLRVNVNGKVAAGSHFLKIKNLYNELGRVRPNPPIAIGFTAGDIADNGGSGGGGGGAVSGITGIALPDGGTQIDGINNPLITMSGGDAFISVSGVSASEIAINFDETQITFPSDHVSTSIFGNPGAVISDGDGTITITGTLDGYVSDIAISGAQIQNTTFAMGTTGAVTVTGIAQDVVIDLPGDLSTITTNISTNSSNISSNSSNITANSSNIGINSSAIASNDTDISNIINSLASSTGAGVLYIASGDGVSKFANDANYITSHYTVDPVAGNQNNVSNNNFIKSIFFDATGHVTGIASAQPTPASIGLIAGTGITLNGDTLDGDPISLTGTQIQNITFAAGGTGAFEITSIAQSVVTNLETDLASKATGTNFDTLSGSFNTFTGGFSTEGIAISNGAGGVTVTGTANNYVSGISITGKNISGVFSVSPGETGNLVITGFSAGITEETDPIFTGSVAYNITTTNTANWSDAYVHSTSTGVNPHGVSIGNIGSGSFTELDSAVTGVDLVKSGDPISFFNNNVPYLTAHPGVIGSTTGYTAVDPYFIQGVTGDSFGHLIGVTANRVTPVIIGALSTSDLNSGGFLRTNGTGAVDEIVDTSRYYDTGKVDAISGAISAEIDSDILAATGDLYTTITNIGYATGTDVDTINTDLSYVSGVLTGHTGASNPHGITAATIGAATGLEVDVIVGDISYVSGLFTGHTGASNPHNITLSTIGAATGTDIDVISVDISYVSGVLTGHTGASNPHNITLSTIGAATGTDIDVITVDISYVSGVLTGHTGAENPHNITASTIGAATGTDVDVISTDISYVSGVLTGHTGQTDIHFTQSDISITASQVTDIGSFATGVDLDANIADISYVSGVLTGHTGDLTNPHNVTANQVNAYDKTQVYTKTEVDNISGALSGDIVTATGDLYDTITAIGYATGTDLDTNTVDISYVSGVLTGHTGDGTIHFALVNTVGDGDTTRAVTPNAVYDHVNTVSGVLASAGGGSTTFTGLTDTPDGIVDGTFYYGSGSNLTGLATGTNNAQKFLKQGADGHPEWSNAFASDVNPTGFYADQELFFSPIRPISYSVNGVEQVGGIYEFYDTDNSGQSYYESSYVYLGSTVDITNIEVSALVNQLVYDTVGTFKIYAVETTGAVSNTSLLAESTITWSSTDDGKNIFHNISTNYASNYTGLKNPKIHAVFENMDFSGDITTQLGQNQSTRGVGGIGVEVEYDIHPDTIPTPKGSPARDVLPYYVTPLSDVYFDKTATGDQTISGSLTIPAGKTLTVEKSPASTYDAVNKSYVDSDITTATSALYTTTTGYINDVSGVLSAEINSDIAAITLDSLYNVSITAPANGEVLKYNSSSSKWSNSTDNTGSGGGGGATDLSPAEAFAWFVS